MNRVVYLRFLSSMVESESDISVFQHYYSLLKHLENSENEY